MEEVVCQIKEYIQPFERRLALQELEALTGGPVVPINGDVDSASIFSVLPTSDIETLRTELAYWRSVSNGFERLTTQVRGEATAKIARSSIEAIGDTEKIGELVHQYLPNHRSLRYATHGIHEYRGKFFPQLVRALINIAQLPEASLVADPMCGSGTTLVEARLSGRRSLGLDLNPLSAFVADVKCQALELDHSMLKAAHEQLVEMVGIPIRTERTLSKFDSFDRDDQIYFEKWFPRQAIVELDHIDSAIDTLDTNELKNLYRVSMSNILRTVSWQKEDDLRLRREEKDLSAGQTIRLFLDKAARSTRTLVTFLAERGHGELGSYAVHESDARKAIEEFPEFTSQVDAVITSPPYATALPYIETDRLSLIYLGLLSQRDHAAKNAQMIGNREISPKVRGEHWNFYQENRALLPQGTCNLIDRIDRLNNEGNVGFRRMNLSALLSKYFFDMRDAIQQTIHLLRPGGTMFLVVGSNRTKAGAEPVDINTPTHLAAIACDTGFDLVSEIPMEMLVSRDIFRKNAVPSESILQFRKPQ